MAVNPEEGGVLRRPSLPRTARERARAEIAAEILDIARRHLATEGAPALSLRAIARDLGMASSALYRYVPSRDALLTSLITDAYDALGVAVESREAVVVRDDLVGRFAAICRSVRAWALGNPNEYALIYGSPVPGYVAPAETVGPASRVSLMLAGVLGDAVTSGRVRDDVLRGELVPPAARALAPLDAVFTDGYPPTLVHAGLMVWMAIFGTVSFELFGQLHGVVGDRVGEREAFFDECIRRWTDQLGLVA